MKFQLFVAALFVFSCVPYEKHLVPNNEAVPGSDSGDIEVRLKGNLFRLKNSSEKCTLTVKKHQSNVELLKDSQLELATPCEFVREPSSEAPLSYDYKRNKEEYSVVIVVGGPPSDEVADRLMPKGCGTEFQALRVYYNRVTLGPKIDKSRQIFLGCPSGGLDEIYFADYTSD
ncbi:MAG: hypothetical protein IPM25_00335 [Chloracidobacterium sp.]|nr:hypothetical protein [Chloracidobacterium sp.]